jgi:hypothetical protein
MLPNLYQRHEKEIPMIGNLLLSVPLPVLALGAKGSGRLYVQVRFAWRVDHY